MDPAQRDFKLRPFRSQSHSYQVLKLPSKTAFQLPSANSCSAGVPLDGDHSSSARRVRNLDGKGNDVICYLAGRERSGPKAFLRSPKSTTKQGSKLNRRMREW